MPGTHPPIFWLGDVNGNIPPILLRTFGYSRPILVALRSLSLKPIPFGYKTPPIRFSQAGEQSAHEARPPQPCTRVDATGCRLKFETEKPGLQAAKNRFFGFEKSPGYPVFRFL